MQLKKLEYLSSQALDSQIRIHEQTSQALLCSLALPLVVTPLEVVLHLEVEAAASPSEVTSAVSSMAEVYLAEKAQAQSHS